MSTNSQCTVIGALLHGVQYYSKVPDDPWGPFQEDPITFDGLPTEINIHHRRSHLNVQKTDPHKGGVQYADIHKFSGQLVGN